MLLHGVFLWYRLATYLSHSIPQWSLRVAAGAAAFSFLCLSVGFSLYLPLAALTVAVSQAKYALRASWLELGPGRYIVIKDQR